ncbi:MAG: hypothetical protein AB1724_11085 [Thermodesulfobacteriota bacterium]
MAKKMTLSVPDDLYEKMLKWKDAFNFSKVFQRAMSALIQKKEDFQARIQQELDQTAVIERLKNEKAEAQNNYFDVGKKEGVQWAKSAHYNDLQYALLWIPDDKPTHDKVLGHYFQEKIEQDDIMDYAVGTDPVCINEFARTFLEGWKEGVNEFWSQIKDKI